MNTNNRGLRTVLLIILILIIAIGAYLLGKNSASIVATETNIDTSHVPTGTSDQDDTTSGSSCDAESTPSIKVISPNGGGSYTKGQQMTVSWSTCNIPSSNKDMSISLVGSTTLLLKAGVTNDGSEVITIPSSTSSGNYKISVGNASARISQDQSDASFAVAASQSLSLPAPYVNGQQGWPPVVQLTQYPYACASTHTENEDSVQKTINGRVYCVTDFHEGAAGSTYHTYTYVTAAPNGVGSKVTSFTLRYASCGVYDAPQNTQCQAAQTNFNANLDAYIASLM